MRTPNPNKNNSSPEGELHQRKRQTIGKKPANLSQQPAPKSGEINLLPRDESVDPNILRLLAQMLNVEDEKTHERYIFTRIVKHLDVRSLVNFMQVSKAIRALGYDTYKQAKEAYLI